MYPSSSCNVPSRSRNMARLVMGSGRQKDGATRGQGDGAIGQSGDWARSNHLYYRPVALSPRRPVALYCCLACASESSITTSTRRFIWRPAAVLLVATGLDLPKPRTALTRSDLTPAVVR